MNLVERNKFWRKNIDEKLHDQRKSLESKGLEFCTFRPNISKVFFKTFSIFCKISKLLSKNFIAETIKINS